MDISAARQVLKTLPKDLNETYDRVLRNIPPTRVGNAIKLLQLLLFSTERIGLTAIVDAVATNPDEEPSFTFQDRIDPARAIVGYCSSFLKIAGPSAKWLPIYDPDGEFYVQLAHFSVQEYLLLDREENPYRRSFGEQSANATITQLCLAYLWTAAEAEQAEEAEEYGHSIPGFPFAEYAARNWLDHARIAGDSEESTFKWICKSFTNDRFAGCWWRQGEDVLEDHLANPALYHASFHGLYRSVEHLLEAGADANCYTFEYGTALQGACESGSIESVRLLMDHGADLNPAYGGRNALHEAAYYGHVEIVLLLLESGALVDATDDESATALQEACEHGRIEVVQLLLEHGAAVNLIGQLGTALDQIILQLRHSSSHEHDLHFTKILRMLLDRGADVNISGNGYEPALLLACTRQRVDKGTVQLLLDHGADPNAAGVQYGNALCAASGLGDLVVVEMLLQAGADVNAVVGQYGTALCAAACYGHVGVMQLLLDNGADLNAQEDCYGEALSAASQSGHTEVVKMLLQRGSDVDIADGKYGEALNVAAHHGHVETLRLLLDNGVDPNAFMGRCGFALCAASRHDSIEMVEALLRKGADINATGGKYDCALCAAACYGHVEVLRVLLENGAISNTHERSYSLALQDAMKKGHEEIARILFEEGAQKQLAITKANCSLRLKVRYDHNR
jgi:ankyrin repeat protein